MRPARRPWRNPFNWLRLAAPRTALDAAHRRLTIAVAVATALLLAASLRHPSLVSTLLAALSPVHEVTRGGLAVAEARTSWCSR
jgi:hypothetical protein